MVGYFDLKKQANVQKKTHHPEMLLQLELLLRVLQHWA